MASTVPTVRGALSLPASCGGHSPAAAIWCATNTRRGAAGGQAASAAATALS